MTALTTAVTGLIERVRTARAAQQSVTCPYCQRPVAGLLSGCEQPACVSAEIAADARFQRAVDL
ncbi:hypothetical protein [Catenuloplanes japonicus]|uniref:hypothetical protein n=1 Tax=Catenuloplanes japonicus TaxID=33876 RepID=UPI0005256BF3|nr:hypothetical protein [Catenuloplanes japonicus]